MIFVLSFGFLYLSKSKWQRNVVQRCANCGRMCFNFAKFCAFWEHCSFGNVFLFFFSFWCATKKSFCRICLYSRRRWVQRWWLLPNIGSAILIEILRWEESGLYWMESIKRPDPLFMTITIINVKIMLITTITLEKQKNIRRRLYWLDGSISYIIFICPSPVKPWMCESCTPEKICP